MTKDYASGKLAGEMEMRERCKRLATMFSMDPESNAIHPDVKFKDMNENARMVAHMTAQAIAQAIASLPPSQTRTPDEDGK